MGNELKLSGKIYHIKFQQVSIFSVLEKILLKVAVGSDLLFSKMTTVLSV